MSGIIATLANLGPPYRNGAVLYWGAAAAAVSRHHHRFAGDRAFQLLLVAVVVIAPPLLISRVLAVHRMHTRLYGRMRAVAQVPARALIQCIPRPTTSIRCLWSVRQRLAALAGALMCGPGILGVAVWVGATPMAAKSSSSGYPISRVVSAGSGPVVGGLVLGISRALPRRFFGALVSDIPQFLAGDPDPSLVRPSGLLS